MVREQPQVIFKNIQVPNLTDISVYEEHGGYQGLRKALAMAPEQVTEEVKRSGLRGRGGAGFPTGQKWAFVPKDPALPKYLVCNADESEPGTFKDRQIMENDPHQIIEGCVIAAYAFGGHRGYIYIRGEFYKQSLILERAVGQAYQRGYLGKNILGSGFDFHLHVHRGAGAYICGEETALLDSLEGWRGQPRVKPPFPASVGLYLKPTVINNVETLSAVTHILANGAEWYASMGTEKSKGTKVFSLSGHINRPGNYELEMGTPLSELIYEHGGGVWKGRKLKAVIPGGSSVPFLTADKVDAALSFEGMEAAGSMLGSGGVMVMDETTCIVRATRNVARFYRHESCGKCTPCREGTGWLEMLLADIEAGQGNEGDLELILDICDNMLFKALCPLSDAAATPVASSVQRFREEYEYHIRHGRCLTGDGRQT